jgi:hypothetical protein
MCYPSPSPCDPGGCPAPLFSFDPAAGTGPSRSQIGDGQHPSCVGGAAPAETLCFQHLCPALFGSTQLESPAHTFAPESTNIGMPDGRPLAHIGARRKAARAHRRHEGRYEPPPYGGQEGRLSCCFPVIANGEVGVSLWDPHNP